MMNVKSGQVCVITMMMMMMKITYITKSHIRKGPVLLPKSQVTVVNPVKTKMYIE